MARSRLRHLVPGASREAVALLDPACGVLEPPIRSEIFGAQRFAQHGRSLGETHEATVDRHRASVFFPRLRDNIRALREAHRYVSQQERTGQHLSPAGEWLLDNFHVVGAQLQEIREGLPQRYFHDLPALVGGDLAGLPRVYGVVWALVAHTDGAFDENLFLAFLDAYQETRELTLGEFWALPTTLRVVLIESLRRLADRVAAGKAARHLANSWCNRLATAPGLDPQPIYAELEARGIGRVFALQLAQRLRHPTATSFAPADAPVRQWLAHALPDPAAALALQQSEDAADNLSVSNAITSLRLLGDTDWRSVIGRTSALMRLMRESDAYSAERDDTQDATLHAIERLARKSGLSELVVVRALLHLMREPPAPTLPGSATQSPRYWLSGAGRPLLRGALGLPGLGLPTWSLLRRRFGMPVYLGTMVVGSLVFTSWFVSRYSVDRTPSWESWLALALLASGPASEAVIAIVNRLISESARPRRLPRLALEGGIPPDQRVLVVVPTLLTSEAAISALAEQLERHHLANDERHAQFALLTDPVDAATERTDADAPLLAAAVAAVQRLNRRHPVAPGAAMRFLLLHRERRFSVGEQRWIGWERKRGKLEQLIDLLASNGRAEPAASPFVDLGELSTPAGDTPYVVTLDSDTQLPPGSLRELIGVAAHPLNQPRIDPQQRRVVAGHGILQPRVIVPLPEPGQATPFHWLFAGQCGTDPYSNATSEVYQDLFNEGSFSGKGLLHVKAMQALLAGRLPEGLVLSHDLLEGSIARCGGVNDIVLIEDAPMHADVAASRVHRWTRGDWQLIPLLARSRHYGISTINRWKMLDNLRRSLVAPLALALMATSLAGWGLAPGAALGLVLVAFGAGPLLGALAGLAPSRDEIALRYFYAQAAAGLVRAMGSALWHLAQLLQEAMLCADAIARALYRMGVSRRGLLQWTTAAAAQAGARGGLGAIARQHVREPILAAALLIVLFAVHTPTPALALAFCVLWGASPLWTWWASTPRAASRDPALSAADRSYLLGVARDTWRLFEHGVGADDNDLPPDNIQVFPRVMVAHRTSPTNIGLYLLATACARRFGWIGSVEMLTRTERSLATLAGLERHRGHFLNWYDTQSLQTLAPAYVSAVDSGNLCVCLIAVASACEERAAAPFSEAEARAAMAASRQRLAAHGQASADTARLLALGDPWAALEADPAGFDAMLGRAAEALAPWDSSADPASSGAVASRLLHDHVAILRSLALDRTADGADLSRRLLAVAAACRRLAEEAEFGFLFNRRRRLLHIGYRVMEQQLDTSFYDLLASESRLASLWAIAKGDIPVAHWAALGRPFFAEGRLAGLRSWSGSMFEYLMPEVLLSEPRGSVLASAAAAALEAQRAFAEGHRVPWGISESAYAASDHTLAYQYAPQGVPRLSLRRTPVDELVIAPYATALATLVAPTAAAANLRRLEALQARDVFGFIEALDYTPERQAGKAEFTRVATFMAHHQGMSIVALANVLLEDAPRRWAMAEPCLQAVDSLLQERVPREVPALFAPPPEIGSADRRQREAGTRREIVPGSSALQPTHLLANGRYGVALRANGAGWSRFESAFVSRWRDDALRDAHGTFFYLRRAGQSAPVSITQHPAPDPAAHYEAAFYGDRVCLEAHWPDLRSQCSVWVSPEDDIELRQIELVNLGSAAIELDFMSMFEVALNGAGADEAHPAFANLFVRAEWNASERALYLERRPRLATEQGLHAVHFVAQADQHVGAVGATADRLAWFGRQRDPAHPLAPRPAPPGGPADADHRSVLDTGLDPIASLSLRLRLPGHATARFSIATAAAGSRTALESLVDKYRQASVVERSSMMSATLAAIRLRELRVGSTNLAAIQTLSTALALLHSSRVPPPLDAGFDRRALWRFGISGDRPIILATAAAAQGGGLMRALVQALRVWTQGGLACDLVVLNDEPASYLMPLQHELAAISERLRFEIDSAAPAWGACALHVLRRADVSATEIAAMHALARVHFNADGRPFSEHVRELVEWHDAALDERLEQATAALPIPTGAANTHAVGGSFSADGARFGFDVSPGRRPPRPWINVLANPDFGAQVSEAGAGYTWAGNSRMHQLTPWSNDPVTDPTGEWLLLQDLATRQVWNVAPGAGCAGTVYRVEHEQGATTIAHRRDDLDIDAQWCVDPDRPVKQLRLRLTDRGARPRRLRVVALIEWMMGETRASRQSVYTRHARLRPGPAQAPTLLLTATQRDAHAGFGGATAFVTLRSGRGDDLSESEWTCDRREFFDSRGRPVLPDHLGESAGAGFDPCAAMVTALNLAPGDSVVLTLLLGHAATPQAARSTAEEALRAEPAARLSRVRAHWDGLLGAVKLRSPDPLFDALVNRWLLYQTVACRLWARAGFYQAGGAFGFRDQLQDAMALALGAPAMLRRQLLLAASRQFREGDVQHWWHMPTGAGVRTHFSDDLLWLVHATLHYLAVTADADVLDEAVPFLEGAAVPPGAEDAYFVPLRSDEKASLFEHCARAIDKSLVVGVHGLPLMGTGDWNDGMNRVGHEGRGESVWLGWFLCALVRDFAPVAEQRGESARADHWRRAAAGWQAALRTTAWDGAWFVRAFFDDGSPLGSQHNEECRIDLIAQAWAVLSGAATQAQQQAAMASVQRLLVDPSAALVRLLDPPLAHAEPSAGYIQAYPPGVRENGGQYSHAAVWALMAQARLGDGDAAWRTFVGLSPAHRTTDPQHGRVYGLEPYVIAGDVYSQPPFTGRGGWSWYTGAAAWLHRACIESIAGLQVSGDRVRLVPLLPSHWPQLSITLRRHEGVHEFIVCASADGVAARDAMASGAEPLPVGQWLVLADAGTPSRHLVVMPGRSDPYGGTGISKPD
jgi:cyclic beta-1,2-glucan synthetase